MTIMLAVSLLFVFLGVMIRFFKWYWLISGYNTMSKARKQKVDIEGLSRFIGNCYFLLAVVMFAVSIMSYFEIPGISVIVPITLVVVVIYLLLKAQDYDSGARNPDGTLKTSTKIILGVIITLLAITIVFVYCITFTSEILVYDDSVQIKGLYAVEIEGSDIRGITIKESIPTIIRRTNGYSDGSSLKGHFELHDIGRVRLYININNPTFIYIDTVDGLIIVNQDDRQNTEKLYRTLIDNIY